MGIRIRGKGCIKFLIMFSLATLCAVFFVLIFNVARSKIVNSNTYAASYAFEDGAFSSMDTTYDSTSVFTISKLKGMKNFATSVNNGVLFRGKLVVLLADIDFWNREMGDYGAFDGIGVKGDSLNQQYTFDGEFDGRNHLVSGFAIRNNGVSQLCDMNDYYLNSIGVGFFAGLGNKAKVHDLALDNFVLNVKYDDSVSYKALSVGGIAGLVAGITKTGQSPTDISIYHCKVSNMLVVQNVASDTPYYELGSILGAAMSGAKLNIATCEVKNISFNSVNSANGDYNFGGIVGSAKDQTDDKGNPYVRISNSVLSGTCPELLTKYVNGNYGYGGAINSNAQNVYLANHTGTYSLPSMTTTLGSGESLSIWYYNSMYKNGVPSLRLFMDWSWCYFTAVNGSVDPEKIELPADADQKFDSNSATITIYGQKIIGTPNEEHDQVSWVANSVFSYTVTFTPTIRTLTFSKLGGVKIKYKINDGAWTNVSTLALEQKVACGTEIEIDYEKYSNRENAYISCTFSFTNLKNQDIKVQFYFDASSKYYITGNSLTASDTYEAHEDNTIKALVALKTYNITFG